MTLSILFAAEASAALFLPHRTIAENV